MLLLVRAHVHEAASCGNDNTRKRSNQANRGNRGNRGKRGNRGNPGNPIINNRANNVRGGTRANH